MKLRCGIEIHQQLSGRKLFCNCPVTLSEGKPDGVVSRRLRAVIGESGVVDVAAAAESLRQRSFNYEWFFDSACLVDLDEAPPVSLSSDALSVGVQAAKLLNASFVDEVQVMRKIVVDGSNTTGFQRSALIARNGFIESSFGRVSIPSVIVEEDSCRRIGEDDESVTYRLDRLGVPLLEVSTGPDIVSPEHCAQVAQQLGLLLRSCKVRRGLGTIRQDVNVSIEGGTRVEIKGAQDLKLLPTIVELEASRQAGLLEIRDELIKRKVKSVDCTIEDVSSHLVKSSSKVISSALQSGVVLGIKLVGFAGLLGRELQPNRRFGSELSDRAKLAGVKGLFHSDELPNYGITLQEKEALASHFKLGSNDAFVIVASDRSRAQRALSFVIERAKFALVGVPGEVRAASEDGSSRFMRPMPGAARMYPETDVLPIRLDKKWINSISLPELIADKVVRFEGLGLGRDLASDMARSELSSLFDDCVKKFDLKPAYIAEILTSSVPNIRRQFNVEISPSEDDFVVLFSALDKGIISKESVVDILKENRPIKDVLSKFAVMSDKDLESAIKEIVAKNKGVPFNALTGRVMSQLRGKASGQKIVELLKKLMG